LPVDLARAAYCLLGLPFHGVDLDAAMARIRQAIATRQTLILTTPNVNFAVACARDARFRDAVLDSHLLVADGMPLVWIARLLGVPIHERVAGSELFQRLRDLEPGATGPVKVFFFGGPPGVADTACRTLNAEARGMVCVGWHSPGYGLIEDMSAPDVIDSINASRADFLVVALGAAKGQAWIQHNRAKLAVPVISHLGAVVNFVAGTVSRAPRWMQRAGLEWLWRIKEEPGLWKRYWADGGALFKLLLTGVLPLAWQQWWRSPYKVRNGRWDRAVEHGTVVLRLRGAWLDENLEPLRRALSTLADLPAPLRVDLSDVSCVDSAFVGSLLLLHGFRTSRDLPLAVTGVQGDVYRVLRWCGADFILQGTAEENSALAGRH
jgi:N-acetylglucosaminyldiphosphoundecaprenol N-acetyl-beta-D-mannosaminyltransferase